MHHQFEELGDLGLEGLMRGLRLCSIGHEQKSRSSKSPVFPYRIAIPTPASEELVNAAPADFNLRRDVRQ
jgi:hypothetical protein